MYFITGGACNGKKQWVVTNFNEKIQNSCRWYCGYQEDWTDILELQHTEADTVVIEGIEHCLKAYASEGSGRSGALFYETFVQPLRHWEKACAGRTLIIIGTDVTKGVVPMEQETRRFRDETGRLFQYLSQHANDMYMIWFGIAKKLL
ncbi:adenosylcobinamide kinase /adenosylcobinamide-phosphate guanylyltransferase [Alteribacillus persepolensis]|uniref:Adenosylcobinamide kinase /adenosylcobinamide-phosphate guanylyltransferase n=1 Tax=Alteribacillus persepolensis TaxID=568899 RepID=A0A1G7ZK71_9BACI|nr:bifunctional adenosylcobinamide kinase/adenosylcobinamide-phosphate guanylyltransferase [Alteribacillus persepolensis]SDH09171.1 adenosylcobinamide kinase /adenosylcobinamide-phosphate guanylyltransferase [Alteribacillus persepolensis]